MPITIVSQPGTTIGPGQIFIVRTSLIGPIPNDWFWRLSVVRPADEANNILVMTAPVWAADDRERRFQVEGDLDGGQTNGYGRGVSANTNDAVTMNMELVGADGTTVHDSGTVTGLRWDSNTSASRTLSSSSGGLTSEQAAQLEDAERRSRVLGEPTDLVVETPSGSIVRTLADLFSRNTLDRLTLAEVTNGPTCEPVRASFSFFYYGVIVRVTTIADELVARTPDHEWYFEDLAVLRIFRGQDLQYRRGIHTPTFLTDQAWEFQWNIRNTLDWLGVPPDNTLAVDWRPGCCGQVYFLKWP